MCLINKKIIAIFMLFFVQVNSIWAAASVEFIASNNTKEINLQTAHERLVGDEQSDLQDKMINVMQENHVEQGKFEGILGVYKMSSDQNITADNSDRFSASPKQMLSDKEIFFLAKQLAIKLNQESVAVFIPDQSNQSTIASITVNFISNQPNIDQVIDVINKNLPVAYSQAFSMQLSNKYPAFNNAKVTKIEWLGSSIHLEDIQRAFPEEKINYEYGRAFLVFQNGQKESI